MGLWHGRVKQSGCHHSGEPAVPADGNELSSGALGLGRRFNAWGARLGF